MRKMGTSLKTWNPFPDVGSRCFNNLIFKGFDSDNRPPQRRGGAQRLMNSDSLKHRVRAMHRGAELVYPILAGCGRVGTHRLGASCQSFSTQLLARRNPRASCSTSCSCARRRISPRAGFSSMVNFTLFMLFKIKKISPFDSRNRETSRSKN